jgi:hypothetical protein
MEKEPIPQEGRRTRVVEVRVLSAQNLPRMDAFGKCDAFCRLTFSGEPRETSVGLLDVSLHTSEHEQKKDRAQLRRDSATKNKFWGHLCGGGAGQA